MMRIKKIPALLALATLLLACLQAQADDWTLAERIAEEIHLPDIPKTDYPITKLGARRVLLQGYTSLNSPFWVNQLVYTSDATEKCLFQEDL